MLKSISMWALKDFEKRPAKELFAEAKEHGFDGIEVVIGNAGHLTPDTTQGQCKELVKTAEKVGIRISSLGSGLGWGHPLSTTDTEARKKAIDVLKKSLRVGGWLGIDCILLVPGVVSGLGAKGKEHTPYDVAYKNMQSAIRDCVSTAEKARVKIGVENVWNKVLLTPLEMRDFIDGCGSTWAAAYLDVGNMIVTGYAEDWIRILGKRVACVHFKDFKRDVGTLAGFCDLLEGDVNYPEVMKAFREIGYDGACVAEFFGLDSAGLGKVSAAMDKILAM